MAELGLLTFSWVLVDFGVSYKNGGPLLHQEMLRLWAERYAQRGSCSVSGFWGIPRWAGQGEAVSSTAERQRHHGSDFQTL